MEHFPTSFPINMPRSPQLPKSLIDSGLLQNITYDPLWEIPSVPKMFMYSFLESVNVSVCGRKDFADVILRI